MNLIKSNFVYRLLQNPVFIFLIKLPFVLAFVFIIFSGLFGNIYRNISNYIVGPLWLAFITITAILSGKIWCLICPWNTLSDWIHKTFRIPRSTLKVPKIFRNFWIAISLFIVLIWLEYTIHLTNQSRLIAYLAIIMFAITFISMLFFYPESFCRYGCPVGAICGLYGLFAPVELRSKDKDICRECRTKDCIKGNEKGAPCPVFEYPGDMDSNLYCILCTECIRTCPNNNIALNLRMPAADLRARVAHSDPPELTVGQASGLRQKPLHISETFLIILMLTFSLSSAVKMSGVYTGITSWSLSVLGLSGTSSLLLLTASLVIFLSVFLYLLSLVSRLNINIIVYLFLPVVLFNHLSNTLKLMNTRAEEIISLISDPFGLNWNLFGTAGHLPKPLFSAVTLGRSSHFLLQTPAENPLIYIVGPLMIIGLLYSAFLTYCLVKTTNKPLTFFLLFFIPMIIIVAFNWWLIPQ